MLAGVTLGGVHDTSTKHNKEQEHPSPREHGPVHLYAAQRDTFTPRPLVNTHLTINSCAHGAFTGVCPAPPTTTAALPPKVATAAVESLEPQSIWV